MGMPDLFLEHKKGAKHQKYLRVKPQVQLFVIGSSKEADLRISGEGVEGCHAALRFRGSDWYICDISGSQSVRINGKTVGETGGESGTEAKVDASAAIEIAGHRFELFSKQRDAELFASQESASDVGKLALHQVVVRSRGRVLETKILPADKAYVYHDGDKKTELPAPRSVTWLQTEIGKTTIQQRLVASQEIIEAEKLQLDRDLRKPFAMALLVFLFMLSTFVFLVPSADKRPEQALDRKSLDIIYNAKVVQKKKVDAMKVVKAAKARAGGNNSPTPVETAKNSQPEESQAPKVSEKAATALTSLRQSGLSNLIGKIAKRANKQGILVAAVGVNPDTVNTGRAFYSTGTSTTGGGGSASKEGPTFRLGGVGTRGKAGGASDFKEGTALAGGNVGSGNIVAMVDDETVIEGGLDRDAIADVIRRNLGQIRYCYERQLSSNPDLYGKILVKFTIGAQGEVADSRVDNSTLKSAMVEGCIMRRMASWKFPEPKGGTQVHVSYPFLFKAN